MRINLTGLKKAVGVYKRIKKICDGEYEGRVHMDDYPVILLNTETGNIWTETYYFDDEETIYPALPVVNVSFAIEDYNYEHGKDVYGVTMKDIAKFVADELRTDGSLVTSRGDGTNDSIQGDDDCLKRDIPLKDFAAMTGINYVNVTEEMKNEKLLQYRPQSRDEKIPEDVYEARMSKLASVDRKVLEKIFLKEPDYKAQYFGYANSSSPAVNQLNAMSTLAWGAPDAKSCERIFAASVWGENMSDDNVRKLANITTNMVSDLKSKIQELRDLKAAELKESLTSKFSDKD